MLIQDLFDTIVEQAVEVARLRRTVAELTARASTLPVEEPATMVETPTEEERSDE